MNSVASREPSVASPRAQVDARPDRVGVLVVEQRHPTPLGPVIVYVNDELCRLSGFARAELIGSPMGLLYDRSDLGSLSTKLPVIAARSNHCYMDRVLLRNGGSRLPCHWTIRPTNREGEPPGYFALTVTPMLPRERFPSVPRAAAEAKPSPAPGSASAAASAPATPARPATPATPAAVPSAAVAHDYENSRIRSLSLAAGGVAHDFKNALQTIKSNLEIAFLELGPLSSSPVARTLSSLKEAQLALDDAELLARQMLDFSRDDSNHRPIVFHIGNLLRRVSRLGAAGSRIQCRLSVPEDLRCVEGFPAQIYQVLHNLVINARQAMPEGGTIHLAAGNADLGPENPFGVPAGRYTVASVKDRGCGIPPENLEHIFEPDFTTKIEGSGVGLASCRALVEQHGGHIRVASKLGVGTEFLVFLPSTEASADHHPVWNRTAEPASARRPSVEQAPAYASGRVLVVDDEPGVRRSTAGLLRRFGYEVLMTGDGESALSIFREHLDSHEPIDAVLLDMTLPDGLSGAEVAVEMARLEPGVRIVATSGNFEAGGPTPAGPFALALAKPYDKDSLREAIERAVAP
jgi:PAS domain S-box-containing protein